VGRELIGADRFAEVYIKASLATCEKRDPKGLYAKARRGEITNMTGIQDPYEEPIKPRFHCRHRNGYSGRVRPKTDRGIDRERITAYIFKRYNLGVTIQNVKFRMKSLLC
jgi:Adenylylsulphate kinase